jgi:hypothetical protein
MNKVKTKNHKAGRIRPTKVSNEGVLTVFQLQQLQGTHAERQKRVSLDDINFQPH